MTKQIFAHIIDVVAREWGVEVSEVLGRSRTQSVAEARMVALAVAFRTQRASMSEIGRVCGFNHGSVWHAVRRVRDLEETEPKFGMRVERVVELIGSMSGTTDDRTLIESVLTRLAPQELRFVRNVASVLSNQTHAAAANAVRSGSSVLRWTESGGLEVSPFGGAR